MIKSVNSIFDSNWKDYAILNSNRVIFWFELFPNMVRFCYHSEIPEALIDGPVIAINNPSRDQILKVIDGKDIYVDGPDLRYLIEHYICKGLVVPTI